MIHKAARQFVTEVQGPQVWSGIVSRCNLNDEHFISGQHYSDEVTVGRFRLVYHGRGVEKGAATDTRPGDILDTIVLGSDQDQESDSDSGSDQADVAQG